MKKNTLLKTALLVVSSLLLAGCDQINGLLSSGMQQMQDKGYFADPAIELPPGWLMNDHGKKVAVYGTNNCLDEKGQTGIEEGCIVIDKQAVSVTVSITGTGTQTLRSEIWTIERGEGPSKRVWLKRPDNSYVTPWQSN